MKHKSLSIPPFSNGKGFKFLSCSYLLPLSHHLYFIDFKTQKMVHQKKSFYRCYKPYYNPSKRSAGKLQAFSTNATLCLLSGVLVLNMLFCLVIWYDLVVAHSLQVFIPITWRKKISKWHLRLAWIQGSK